MNSEQLSHHVFDVNKYSHINYLHPNRMEWENAGSDKELEFLSLSLVGEDGQQEKAVAYLYKELAQLAEIEMHVASVMSRVLCELQQESTGLITNTGLFHSVSCFASEEVQHSNSFYQYVRHLSGRDIKLRQNYAKERLELYEGNENPLVKLAALCSTAYVGESIITVFERRMKVLDPMQKMFLTQLLHFHGLDEARHIEFDHFVFEHIIPSLTSSERKRMHEIINIQEELNTQLALTTEGVIKSEFDLDYTENNLAAKKQLDMTLRFREIIQSGEYIKNIDEHIDDNTAEIVKGFSKSKKIHVFG